mgnify:CR=1 FL=1
MYTCVQEKLKFSIFPELFVLHHITLKADENWKLEHLGYLTCWQLYRWKNFDFDMETFRQSVLTRKLIDSNPGSHIFVDFDFETMTNQDSLTTKIGLVAVSLGYKWGFKSYLQRKKFKCCAKTLL